VSTTVQRAHNGNPRCDNPARFDARRQFVPRTSSRLRPCERRGRSLFVCARLQDAGVEGNAMTDKDRQHQRVRLAPYGCVPNWLLFVAGAVSAMAAVLASSL
jgi:hypothetical protein